MKLWFESWFNTPYYHILYSHRDEAEAEDFILRLTETLKIPDKASVIDLACGAGRHSIFLNKLGYDVTGIDISENSISIARESENETLHFLVGDVRNPLPVKNADLVLNLFTSFGYFETLEEHEQLIANCHSALKKKGLFLIDYFNSDLVIKGLVPEMSITKNDIKFDVKKHIEKGRIFKTIRVTDNGHEYNFQEKVWLFSKEQFIEMLTADNAFSVREIYGNYNLDPYSTASERMIIIAQKNA